MHGGRGVRLLLVVLVVVAGCAPGRGALRSVPPGSGWVCGARGDGTNFCVRREADCTNAATACAPHNVAYCFTYLGADSASHHSCKPTMNECDDQALRFLPDEREVSRCEARN